MWLGGDDFDQVIVDEAVRYVRDEYDVDATSAMRFMVELRRAARGVKEQLAAARSADLIVNGLLEDADRKLIDLDMEITRTWYELQITPLVDRTVSLVERALAGRNLTPADVDHVVMAGGSSGLPLVQRAMEEMFGADKVLRRVHPKHCVAMGAALLAARLGGVVCQVPSPARPGEECGQVNAPTATACSNCGADLDELGAGSGGEDDGEITLDVTGIAPFPYGIQSAGDQFTIFVEKGEPYPTEDLVAHDFFTRMPNQRMISLPIFGGADRERASANERQGEAFAVLPAGLPQATPVRVKLWLDDDGVLKLSAHLRDGSDLMPWLVARGESMDRAIKALEEVEQTLGAKAQSISAGQMAEVDRSRERVFKMMREGKLEKAQEEVEHFGEVVDDAGAKQESDLTAQARNLCGFADFVVHEFGGWVIQAYQVATLKELIAEVRTAVKGARDDEVQTAMANLEGELDELPPEVNVFLSIQSAIEQVRPTKPAEANRLRSDLEAAKRKMRAGEPAGMTMMESVMERLNNALAEVSDQPVDTRRCSRNHEVPPGARYCPIADCHEDMWIVIGRRAGPSTADIRFR